jgi:hypothetical protein
VEVTISTTTDDDDDDDDDDHVEAMVTVAVLL